MAKKKLRRGNNEGSVFYVPSRDKWRAYVTNPTGIGPKRKYFSGDTREEAHQKMVQALANPDSVFLPADLSRLTVEMYLNSWLESVKPNVREGTYRGYAQIVRCHLVPSFGRMKLKALGSAHIREMKTRLLSEGLKPSTVARVQAVLSQALKQAYDDELIPKNPATAVSRARVEKRDTRILEPGEAMRLIDVVRGTRDEAFFTMALLTGMRKGELLALRWEDVDLQSGKVRVRRSVRTEHGGEVFGPPKNGEEREIGIGENLIRVLSAHRLMQKEERLRAKTWVDRDLVFPGHKGQVRRHRSVWELLRGTLEAASLPQIRFHDLRHTAISLMLHEGIDILAVAETVGHKDPSLTWRVYSHRTKEGRETAVAAMDGLLS